MEICQDSVKFRMCALISDFGGKDYFAGVLKGVMKKINPHLEIIDICHEIPSYNILPASFALEKAFPFFPQGTIFIAIVDPGVGTARKILLVDYQGYYFLGPDNGILTPILEKENKMVYTIENRKFFLIEDNSTFEARDKMAPSAAYLSMGIQPRELGPEVSEFTINPNYFPVQDGNTLKGRVVYHDKYGNCMTNISRRLLFLTLQQSGFSNFKSLVNDREIKGYYHTYELAGRVPFMLIGSHQNLEIAINQGSAARVIDIQVGQEVIIHFY